MNLLEIFNGLPDKGKETIRAEVMALKPYLNKPVSELSRQEVTDLLSLLGKERDALSVKVIQTETQLETKQKELDEKLKALFESHGVTDIAGLDAKRAALEKELDAEFGTLRTILEGVTC